MEEWEAGTPRARDAAIALPFLAAALLLPPLILIFAVPAAPWGVPLIVLYVFGAWAATILAGFLLARRLKGPPAPREADGEG
jgi:hypothetical protein